ncbi:hypothetical protein [Nonlabens sp. Asnod2-A12]|uniref:hypothetical protein n=1 Tax=Nonlabens sp. Asnod2-A12 TaxID=3160578 RepID=UPI00386969E6
MRYKKYVGFPLVVIVVASLWFISKYKDVYKEEIEFNVNFINVPEDVVVNSTVNQLKIPVEISSSGFTLIWEKTFGNKLNLDFKKNTYSRNDSLFFNPSKSLKNMKRSKEISYEILNVEDQEVSIDVKRFDSKRVPLVNEFKIEYSSNFVPLKEPAFTLDSVTVTGNDTAVAELKEIRVTGKPIIVSDSITSININLNEKYPDLRFENPNISLTIAATQMTEGSIESYVQLINAPSNVEVKLIPEKVTVVYSTPIAQFDKIDNSDVRVIVDYNKVNDLNTAIIPEVRLINSNMVSSRILPKQIQVLTIK